MAKWEFGLYSTEGLARILGYSGSYLRRLIRAGELPTGTHSYNGKCCYFDKKDVRKLSKLMKARRLSKWARNEKVKNLAAKGWTQTRIAAACGITQSTVSLLLRPA